MSRTLTTLTAVVAFTAIVATGSAAQAQPGMGAPMQQSPSASMSGSADMTSSAPPVRAERSHGMRHERRAMRRQMRAERRAENNPDGAFMGGGGVYERLPDGSLSPVR